ncbi:MAG: cyclic nucleotide-binding domain-containing protein [Bdellovibrionales bacterium]
MLEVFWTNFFVKKKDGEMKYIKDCPLFAKLSSKELQQLRKILHRRLYTAGEIIFKASAGTGMYIILKGSVNILYGSPESQEESSLISSLKAGDFFGELSLANNEPYHRMFAQSATNSQLLAFYKPDLDMVLKTQPAIGIKILNQLCFILSHRLKKAEQKILQIKAEK